jgi:hypothetical protein
MLYARATMSGKWDYVPVSPAPRMFSEHGPLASAVGATSPDATKCLSSLSGGMLAMDGGQGMSFGKTPGATLHDEFLDVSMTDAPEDGAVSLASADAADGDVIVTLWPRSRALIPGRVRVTGRRMAVDLAGEAPAGERCFVLDEAGERLITVGMRSDGDISRIAPRLALVSWLISGKSPVAGRIASRFIVEEKHHLGHVIVADTSTGRKYEVGAIGRPEVDDVRWSLAVAGIAGIAGRYDVEAMG